MPALNNWTIIVSPYNPELRSAKFECPKCRQSMLTSDPDRAIFRHCGRVDFLTLDQRERLLSADPHAAEKQAVQNFAALERTANAPQPRWNESAAWKAEEAKIRADADAFEKAKRELETYNLLTRTPRQPGKESEQYIPGVKDV
ncbi:MAG: hypothetical protein AUH28_16330 [Acidobacteria bacterium 13_1_40CM_56_16]|nr:MAG: hypothetical protein AUH28_16330 [Acidobacteria bacterium 13_1_40CM_56_16]